MQQVMSVHKLATAATMGMSAIPQATLGRTFGGPIVVAPPQDGRSAQPSSAITVIPTTDVTVVSIPDIVRYFRRRWKTALMLALPLAIGTFAALGFGRKVYESEARLLLRIQDTNVFNFNEMTQNRVTELSAPMLVNNHLAELRAHRYVDYLYNQIPESERTAFIAQELEKNGVKSWHRELREKIGLAEPLKKATPKELFCAKLAEVSRVEPLKESHVLRVLVRHTNPTVAANIANHYVNDYIAYVSEQELSFTRTASQFLGQKSDELQRRLQESEKELASYRQSEDLVQDSEVKDVYGEKVRLLTTALADAEVKLTRTRHDLESIRAAKAAGRDLLEIKVVADNSDVSGIRKQLETRIAERAPLLADCGPNHPKVRGLNDQIQSLQTTLDRNIAAVVAMVESEEANHRNQVADFQAQLEQSRAKVLASGGKNVQQNLLRDRVAMDRELYQKIMLRMNQADLTGQFKDNGLLRVADVATTPNKPVKPSKPLAAIASILLFGLVFFGVPVGWGLAEDHLAPALRDQQKSATPHSAPAPETTCDATPATPITHSGTAAVCELNDSVVAALPDVVAPNPASLLIAMMRTGSHAAGTALRQIALSLEKNRWTRNGPGIVLVTSADAREGKSLVASALAATMCSQGRSAFLIESNPTSPTAHEFLPNVRSDSASASDLESLRYGSTNLFVLPARGLPSKQMNDLIDGYRIWIERAKQAGIDWIILDSAPLLLNFADVAPLVPMASDVLFVRDRMVSSDAQVKAALNLLRPMIKSDAMRGVVMNRESV